MSAGYISKTAYAIAGIPHNLNPIREPPFTHLCCKLFGTPASKAPTAQPNTCSRINTWFNLGAMSQKKTGQATFEHRFEFIQHMWTTSLRFPSAAPRGNRCRAVLIYSARLSVILCLTFSSANRPNSCSALKPNLVDLYPYTSEVSKNVTPAFIRVSYAPCCRSTNEATK